MGLEALGWIGAAALSLCGVPQALKCYRDKHARGLSGAFIALWVLGELCTMAYLLVRPDPPWPLVANYAMNLCVVAVILYYKVVGRSRDRRARGARPTL